MRFGKKVERQGKGGTLFTNLYIRYRCATNIYPGDEPYKNSFLVYYLPSCIVAD